MSNIHKRKVFNQYTYSTWWNYEYERLCNVSSESEFPT